MKFATPNPSPSKQTARYQSSYGTPHSKKQRLFSPTSLRTPDKFDVNFHPSYLSPSLDNTSMDGVNGNLSSSTRLISKGICGCDVMMCSPPRIERLKLFDSPRTPGSIARSSGIHVAASNQNQLETNRHPKRLNSRSRYVSSVYKCSAVRKALLAILDRF